VRIVRFGVCNAVAQSDQLLPVALVSGTILRRLGATSDSDIEASEIVNDACLPVNVYLNAFFSYAASSVSAIQKRRDGSIGETHRYGKRLARYRARSRRTRQRGFDAVGQKPYQPARKVYEMAALAQKSSAPVVGVVQPMIRGKFARIHSDNDLGWAAGLSNHRS
jgi:hypothetical protein